MAIIALGYDTQLGRTLTRFDTHTFQNARLCWSSVDEEELG